MSLPSAMLSGLALAIVTAPTLAAAAAVAASTPPCPFSGAALDVLYQSNSSIFAGVSPFDGLGSSTTGITRIRVHQPQERIVGLDFSDPANLIIHFGPGIAFLFESASNSAYIYHANCQPKMVQYPCDEQAAASSNSTFKRDVNPMVSLSVTDQCDQPYTGALQLECTPLSFPQGAGGTAPTPGEPIYALLDSDGVGTFSGSCDISSLDAQINARASCIAKEGAHPFDDFCGLLDKFTSAVDNLKKYAGFLAAVKKASKAITGALTNVNKACSIYDDPRVQPLVDAEVHAEDCGYDPEISLAISAVGINQQVGIIDATQATLQAAVSVTDPTKGTCSDNLIGNPSFEQDTLWQLQDTLAEYQSGNAYQGSRYLLYDGTDSLHPYVVQDFPAGVLFQGTTYNISFAYRSIVAVDGCYPQFFCESTDGQNGISQIAVTGFGFVPISDGAWHVVYAVRYTGPGSGAEAGFCGISLVDVLNGGLTTNCAYGIDVVSVTKVGQGDKTH